MGEAVTFVRLVEVVPAATVTTLLVIAIWYLYSSRVPTPREYDTMKRLLQEEQERAEAERERADRKERDAREAHDRLKDLPIVLQDMAEFIESIDRRLDMHGLPRGERTRLRWPWGRRGSNT